MSPIRTEILAIIASEAHVEPAKVQPTATLRDLEISSLEVIEIAFAIEERFGVTLPDRDPAYASSCVGDLVDGLERMVRTLSAGQPTPAAS